MSKLINAMRSKLVWYLLSCIVFAGVMAVLCAYIISQLGAYLVENTFDDQEYNRRFQLKYIENLREYVKANDITQSNVSRLEQWAVDNPFVYFSVYKGNTVIFNSDYLYPESEADSNADFENMLEDRGDDVLENDTEEPIDIFDNSLFNSNYFYQLELADGTMTSVDMFCYDYWNYNYYVLIVAGIVGILVFVGIFTRGIQKKLLYINQLEQELRILEGGNLEYPITVKGVDELGNLANGIDQMRLSIIENRRQEEKILQANKDLVTAMSHDLRTPLTTLTGYLEILNMDNVSNEEKRKQYLELSLDKTREIKELSDELFEYFLVYEEDNRHIDVEAVPAAYLVEDLIENQFLSLEEDGYVISGSNDIKNENVNCLINTRYMRRVLNNILSNLMKYADKESPIGILAEMEEGFVVIKVRNVIRKNLDQHESTKIGLVTCERIMKLHHGKFEYYSNEGEFVVKLSIPVSNE